MRTKKELRNYLCKNYEADIVNNVVNKIDAEGYLNDDVYASSYVNDQINLSNKGYFKILRELNDLEISEDISKKYLDKIDKDIWLSRINKLIDKKIKVNKKNSVVKLKDKITYDLVNLGYDKEFIIKALSNKELDDSDALRKEFNLV